MYVIEVKLKSLPYAVTWVIDDDDTAQTMKFLERTEEVEYYTVSLPGSNTFLDVPNEFGFKSGDMSKCR